MPHETVVAIILVLLVLLVPVLKWARDRWMSSPIRVNVIIDGHLAPVNLGDVATMASEAVAYVTRVDAVDVDPARAVVDVGNQGTYIRKQLEKAGHWKEAFKRSRMSVDEYVVYLIGCGFWTGVLVFLAQCGPETQELVYGDLPSEFERDEEILNQAEAIRDLLTMIAASRSMDDQSRARAEGLRSHWAAVLAKRERDKARSR
jgi:hypothetical protein